MIHYGERDGPASRTLRLADADQPTFDPGEIVYEPPGWASSPTGVNVHEYWNDGEYLYQYYYINNDSGSSLEIGVARAGLGGMFA